jgi:hypothetical protein
VIERQAQHPSRSRIEHAREPAGLANIGHG